MSHDGRSLLCQAPTERPTGAWWKQIPRWWRESQWLVVGGLGVLAVVLGYVGFGKSLIANSRPPLPWDVFYLALQLFPLQSGAVSPVPWELQVARFLAPAVTAYTAAKALAAIFYGRLQSLRLWSARNHVVVCGLGRKGFLLVRGFRALGKTVVVLERDPANALVVASRELGAIVLIGDATTPELLLRARVDRAKHVACVCDEDGVNAEVALQVCDVVVRRGSRGPTCYVHIVDPQLCTLLREREFAAEGGDSFALEFFNVYDCGARKLLRDHPPFDCPESEGPPHLLVVGLGRMGHGLVIQAARSWCERPDSREKPLRIAIIDREATRKARSLTVRYPRLGDACELVPLDMEIRSPEFEDAAFLYADPERRHVAVTMVYVCLDDDSSGLFTALALLQRLKGRNVPIIVRMKEYGGLATLLGGGASAQGIFRGLHAFGLLDQTCNARIPPGGYL